MEQADLDLAVVVLCCPELAAFFCATLNVEPCSSTQRHVVHRKQLELLEYVAQQSLGLLQTRPA